MVGSKSRLSQIPERTSQKTRGMALPGGLPFLKLNRASTAYTDSQVGRTGCRPSDPSATAMGFLHLNAGGACLRPCFPKGLPPGEASKFTSGEPGLLVSLRAWIGLSNWRRFVKLVHYPSRAKIFQPQGKALWLLELLTRLPQSCQDSVLLISPFDRLPNGFLGR
jgi:hypothetical protein